MVQVVEIFPFERHGLVYTIVILLLVGARVSATMALIFWEIWSHIFKRFGVDDFHYMHTRAFTYLYSYDPECNMVIWCWNIHYCDVIMGVVASRITSFTIVYSTVYSDADQRKHQSSAPLAFVRGIHRGPVNSPHKWPVTRKMFPFDYVITPRDLSKWPGNNIVIMSKYIDEIIIPLALVLNSCVLSPVWRTGKTTFNVSVTSIRPLGIHKFHSQFKHFFPRNAFENVFCKV